MRNLCRRKWTWVARRCCDTNLVKFRKFVCNVLSKNGEQKYKKHITKSLPKYNVFLFFIVLCFEISCSGKFFDRWLCKLRKCSPWFLTNMAVNASQNLATLRSTHRPTPLTVQLQHLTLTVYLVFAQCTVAQLANKYVVLMFTMRNSDRMSWKCRSILKMWRSSSYNISSNERHV